MFLTEQKLEKRLEELKKYRYRDIIPVGRFSVKEDTAGMVNPEVPKEFSGWDTISVGDRWEGRDKYLWLHREICIPEEWKGRKVVGVFDFGKTGGGNNSGFESLCYLNGEPYQGVDSNHEEVFFPEELSGKEVSMTFRLWSGLEGGGVPVSQEHKIQRAELAWMDEETDDFYYLGDVVLETIRNLNAYDPVRGPLKNALDEACGYIDWSYPGSEEFYDSVHKADKILNEKIDSMEKHPLVRIRCVGHTHIDMAWLWRLKHTREKASRSFSTVLRLMEMFPEYVFLQTQPQIYEYVKEDFPEIYEKIKERIKEGRWEPDGAMWVEADCNLTGGESLTRQILIGSRFFKEEFGKEVEYLWLPDVFGYSWALPQILKKSGIDMFMTTKISWNQFNRMPHDTFKWRGIDGSEVLTHFITTPEPTSQPGSWFYTYNGMLTPKTVKGTWEAYSDKELNQDLLISYGYGDGGGGVNRDMLEKRRRIDKVPGLPSLKTSTAGEYFRDLKETVKSTKKYVHTWDGELYLEYHRGTYTSQAYNKRMNRRMEMLYRRAEWLTAMQGIFAGDLGEAAQEELTKGWKKILTNQFHDIIPGSSIREVYEDCHKDYAEIQRIAEQVEDGFQKKTIEEKDGVWTVWNGSSWMKDEIVYIPDLAVAGQKQKEEENSGQEAGCFTDEAGKVLSVQKEESGYYVRVEQVPSMGHKEIYYRKGLKEEGQTENAVFSVNGRNVETPYYLIAFNEVGQIARLYDKTFHREVLAEGARGNVLQVFEDKPLDYEAWDIDIFYQQKMREITDLRDFRVKEKGVLKLTIHMEWKYMNSVISQDMILYRDSGRIDFKTEVDFHEQQQLLKAAFPVNIRSTYATYDVQYGNVRRPNHWNTSWDYARFESVAHRFADLSERNYGVSILNDCKYGHDIKDNVIRITLLRAGKHPDYRQDQGMHSFTYALLPHGGDFVEGQTVQEAFSLNNPFKVCKGKTKIPYESFATFDNEQIEVDAVKKSEDGKYVVLRFHEFAGSSQSVKVMPGFAFKSWMESDLRERPITERQEGEISLSLHPYEIKTILLEI